MRLYRAMGGPPLHLSGTESSDGREDGAVTSSLVARCTILVAIARARAFSEDISWKQVDNG